VIVGQRGLVEHVVTALIIGGHVLIEGAPGLGKTLLVRTLASALDLSYNRVQCTPDLMPGDITGSTVLQEDPDTGRRALEFKRGPIFANFVLADEINRATPRTQSALLEAMQESAVTASGVRHELPNPFVVAATQNPIEMEGTFPLPEAQLDRFLFKLTVNAPDEAAFVKILEQTTSTQDVFPKSVIARSDILRMRSTARQCPAAREMLEYASRIVMATDPGNPLKLRNPVASQIRYGASPRAAQALILAAKSRALCRGGSSVSYSDIESFALPVLRHRISLRFEAIAEGATTDLMVKRLIENTDDIRPGRASHIK